MSRPFLIQNSLKAAAPKLKDLARRAPFASPQTKNSAPGHSAPGLGWREGACWAPLLAFSLLATGCELGGNLEDLAQELGNPESETVEVGGRRIAEGQFRSLRFDGTAADGALVLALKDGNQLNVLPFSGAPGCAVDDVDTYRQALVRDDEVALDARIPIVREADGETPRRLQFIDFACDTMDVEVNGAGLPLNSSFAESPGFIVETDDDDLVFVDPWSAEKRVIAEDVAEISRNRLALFRRGDGDEDWMWTIEGGQLVARDSNFEEVTRGGNDVTAVRFTTLEGEAIVIMTEGARTLSWAPSGSLQEQTSIADDACRVSVGSGDAGRQLRYLQPCDEGKLWAHDLVDSKLWEYPAGVTRYSVAGSTEEGPIIM